MYGISDYIGEKVRRIVINIRDSKGKYYQLFTIYEHLERDMQDINDFPPTHNNRYFDRVRSQKGKDSVYLVVDYVELTKDMVESPWKSLQIGPDKIRCFSDQYEWRTGSALGSFVEPLHDDEKSEVAYLLPNRHCSAFVNYCFPSDKSELNKLCSTERIRSQVKELSLRNLGFDLLEHSQFIGSFIYVAYNPIYKQLDLRKEPIGNSVFVRTCYRTGRKDNLEFNFVLKDKERRQINQIKYCNDGNFLCMFQMPNKYHHLELTVRDESGNVVDFHPCIVFIEKIQVDMQIKTAEVHVKDQSGKTVKVIDKFVSESPIIIGKNPQTSSIWDFSPEYSYKKLEDALDFVFFDGDTTEEGKKSNQDKAFACIGRILDSARKRIMICDVYFDEKALELYVLPVKLQGIQIKILSSKEGLSQDDKRQKLKAGIEGFNGKKIANVECRLLKGEKPILHDRFIIADDNVWMLGCSLNEFSVRATSLIRVPKEYRKKIIERAEVWWSNIDISDEI